MPPKQNAKAPKGRKIGRAKKKVAGRGTPAALFARGKITAEEYFRQTGQK